MPLRRRDVSVKRCSSGDDEAAPEGLGEAARVPTRGGHEVQGPAVVVDEDLGSILKAVPRRSLDPRRGLDVAVGADGPGKLVIADLCHKGVGKEVLALPG